MVQAVDNNGHRRLTMSRQNVSRFFLSSSLPSNKPITSQLASLRTRSAASASCHGRSQQDVRAGFLLERGSERWVQCRAEYVHGYGRPAAKARALPRERPARRCADAGFSRWSSASRPAGARKRVWQAPISIHWWAPRFSAPDIANWVRADREAATRSLNAIGPGLSRSERQ